MGVQLFANGAAATLSGTLAQGGTTMTLATGMGAKFPSITGSDYFYVTLFTKDAFAVEQNIEVVKVTARTGDTLTLVRDVETMTGQPGGFAYDGNATTVYVQQRNTAMTMDNMLQKTGNLAGLADTAVARENLGLGTAAPLNVPASGNAAAGEVVKGSDTRLVDARTPTAHNQAASTISDSTSVGREVLTAEDAAAARRAIGARVAMAAPVTLTANTTLASNAAYRYTLPGLSFALPPTPSNGDEVVVINAGTVTNANVTGNGKTIMRATEPMTLDIANRVYVFTYCAAEGDWVLS